MQSRLRLPQRFPWMSLPSVPSPSASVSQRHAAVAKIEGEDAAMTGLTRSLHRRLLGLNLGQQTPMTVSDIVVDVRKVA